MTRKLSIRNVKELLEHDKVLELINIFEEKISKSFTARDANFISKSIAIVYNHCFYELVNEFDKFEHTEIDKARVETDSEDSDFQINVEEGSEASDISIEKNRARKPSGASVDTARLKLILDKISLVGDPRRLYSNFISLIHGNIRNDKKYMLLASIANCLSRIETRRTPLIANVLASMHTLINQQVPSSENIEYCLYFMDKIWYEPLPEDTHGVSNSCFKCFSAQLNEKLFYKLYQDNEVIYENSIREICCRFIKNEGDVLDWYVNLIKMPSSAFKGPLESTHMQESLLSYTLLDFGYLRLFDLNSQTGLLPLVYSGKARGIMAMHSSLALIKSCRDLNNLLFKSCILRILSWGINQLKEAGYKITTFKGTLWEPNEIIQTLEVWNEPELLKGICDMILSQDTV